MLPLVSYNDPDSLEGKTMRRFLCLVLILSAAVLSSAQNAGGAGIPPYKNPSLPVEQRVQDLLGRMTLQEKVAMLSGAIGCRAFRMNGSASPP
jgi:hypothetical protein